MAINFPNNPAVNDTFTVGGTTFTFTGVKWETSAVVELSSDTTPTLGGNLDGGAKNINNVGVITATTFSGNVTGNLTGNADTATTATTATIATYAETAGISTYATTAGISTYATTAGVSTNAQGLTGDPSIQVTNATVLGNLDVQGTTSTIDTAVTAVDSLNVDGAVVVGAGISAVGDVSIGGHVGNHTVNGLWLESSGDIRVTGSSSNTIWAGYQNGTAAATSNINADGSAEFAGTISDSIGPLRRLGINAHNAATYTLVAGDAGKLVREATNGANITIPQNVFASGDMISIFNVSTGNNTIAQGTGTTLYNSADAATGNRTLAAKGMCTIVCTASNEFVISGTQLT